MTVLIGFDRTSNDLFFVNAVEPSHAPIDRLHRQQADLSDGGGSDAMSIDEEDPSHLNGPCPDVEMTAVDDDGIESSEKRRQLGLSFLAARNECGIGPPIVTREVYDLDTALILLDFLYTQQIDPVMNALIPIPTSGAFNPDEHKKRIVADCTLATILRRWDTTNRLHKNTTALGISNAQLEKVIQYALGVLTEAAQQKLMTPLS